MTEPSKARLFNRDTAKTRLLITEFRCAVKRLLDYYNIYFLLKEHFHLISRTLVEFENYIEESPLFLEDKLFYFL